MSDQPPVTPAEAVPTDGGPIYCRSCGAEIEVGSQFCSKCGTPTRATGADPTMVAPVVPVEPLRRTTVVDEPAVYADEPMPVVRSADSWWSGPFIFMAAAILVVLIVVLAVALSRDEPTNTTTTTVPQTVPTTVATTAATAPIIVPAQPPPTQAPAQAPPVIINNPPPQQAPPQTTASTTTTSTTTSTTRP